VEILPFTPANRNNLIGWIAGRSDGEHYGTSIVYDFPKTKQIDGPLQIERASIRTRSFPDNCRLEPARLACASWNLLVNSVRARRCCIAEPIYLQGRPQPHAGVAPGGAGTGRTGLAYAPTFEAALSSLFGGGISSLRRIRVLPTAAGSGKSACGSPTSAASSERRPECDD